MVGFCPKHNGGPYKMAQSDRRMVIAGPGFCDRDQVEEIHSTQPGVAGCQQDFPEEVRRPETLNNIELFCYSLQHIDAGTRTLTWKLKRLQILES